MALGQIARHHRVIARGVRKYLRGESGAQRQRGLALMRRQLFQQGGVVCRVYDDRYGIVVLRRGAQHGGAANIDVLDSLGVAAVGARNSFSKRIKIDYQEVDRRYLMQRHHRVVHSAAPEQTAVNLWM